MNSILMYLFSKTQIGKVLDGKKTVIGAVLVIAVAALQALEQLAPMFPNASWLVGASKGLQEILKAIEPVLETLGLAFLTAGVLHKNAKNKTSVE